ncbi:MAG: alkaline phosphatase [Cyclobacteriaceae bacterium]
MAVVALAIAFQGCRQREEAKAPLVESVSIHYDSALKPFYHGVASGDPLPDRVIIWTRVTPASRVERVAVEWEVSEDEQFASIYKADTTSTGPNRDYTVKIDVDALKPGKTYYYRFKALGYTSMAGRTKTATVDLADSIKFAVVSCSNWEWGYFNAYEKIAERPVLDAVIHLGDYIYEYGVGKYGDTTIGRFNLPPHEIVTLQDYRTRYALYRLDRGLRRVHQQHPFIAIWDDHEVANNSYTTGAQNHQANEGDYQARKAAARQAYYEWLPIREGGELYRSFSFGSIADLIMLDERLAGRTAPVDSLTDPNFESADRHMLGSDQLAWFQQQLQKSKATWKVIGNQVIFSDVYLQSVYPNMPRNLDSWDGYPAERRQIKDFIVQNQLRDIIFLTGDTHASWAIEAIADDGYNVKTSAGAFAVEFGTTSISSANDDEYTSPDTVKMMEQVLLKANPHIKYINSRDHGYLLLSLHPDRAKGEWYYVNSLREPVSGETLAKAFEVQKGSVRLR